MNSRHSKNILVFSCWLFHIQQSVVCVESNGETCSLSLVLISCFSFLSHLSSSYYLYFVNLPVRLAQPVFWKTSCFLVHRSCVVAVKDRGATWSLCFSNSIYTVFIQCHEIKPWRLSRCVCLHCDPFSNQTLTPDSTNPLSMSCPECDARITLQASNGLFEKGSAQSLQDGHRNWPRLLLNKVMVRSSQLCLGFFLNTPDGSVRSQLHMALTDWPSLRIPTDLNVVVMNISRPFCSL